MVAILQFGKINNKRTLLPFRPFPRSPPPSACSFSTRRCYCRFLSVTLATTSDFAAQLLPPQNPPLSNFNSMGLWDSLLNCVVNFLIEENYLLTAFELLHELLDDGRDAQAIRLKELFSEPSQFPPEQISRFNSLKATCPCQSIDKSMDSAVLTRMKQFRAMDKLKKLALKVIAQNMSEEEIKDHL